MPISVFLDPTQLPARTQEQQVFDNFMAQFMQNLPTLAAQINSTEAGMNAVAAGGAYAVPYALDFSSTADGDPGNGKLRFNSTTQSTATTLYLDVFGFDTADYTGLIDTFDMSSSTIKGALRLVKLGDPKKFLAFQVTARTTATGYRKLTVTPIVSSSANPFAAGDVVLAKFTPTGDKGEIGARTVMHVRDEKPSGTTGGASPSGGEIVRTLNSVVKNTISGASLLNSQVNLPAGTYQVYGSAPAVLGAAHRVTLRNVTSGSVLLYGTSESSAGQYAFATRSFVSGELTLTVPSVIELRHYFTASNQYGLGYPVGSGVEVYAELILEKWS